MHCSNCGKKIEAGVNYCDKCGYALKNSSDNTEKAGQNKDFILGINITKKQTILFYTRYLKYKGQQIFYRDIIGISYLLTRTTSTVYFVPVSKTSNFEIKIETYDKKYRITSNDLAFAFRNKNNEEKEQTFAKLMYVLESLIKPYVLINQLQIYSQNKLITVGSLKLDAEGIHKKGIFGKGTVLAWDQYYNSQLSRGAVLIYRKDTKKDYKVFHQLSMIEMNAVILPEILNILFQFNGRLEPGFIKEIQERKLELNKLESDSREKEEEEYCHSCGAPINNSDVYCIHCGSKLN